MRSRMLMPSYSCSGALADAGLLEGAASMALIDRLGGNRDTLANGLGFVRDHQSRARAQKNNVTKRVFRALQEIAYGAGIFFRCAAFQSRKRAALQPGVLGRDLAKRHL